MSNETSARLEHTRDARGKDSQITLPKRVVVTSRYQGAHRARLEALFHSAEVCFLAARDSAGIRRALVEADIAILRSPPEAWILDHPRLSWVHCNISGMDACAGRAFIESDLIMTSASGRSSAVLAEHAIFFMLALAYNAPALLTAQRRRVWGLRDQNRLRGLENRKALIVGMGHTAKALIPRCRALGMEVMVYRRRDLGDEGLGVPVLSFTAGDRIEQLLPEADVILLAASLNDTSHELLGSEQFAAIKRGALLINVARSRLVNTAAFKVALRSGALGGAGLDVADREPLPPWDDLWRLSNVLITPHSTPRVADRETAEIDIIEDNFRRYLAGEPMRNRLDPDDLYTHPPDRPASRLQQTVTRLWQRAASPAARRL